MKTSSYGLLSLVLTLSHLWAATSTSIPIVIDNPAGLEEPWPLTCGVPFPKGALRDASALWLADKTGKRGPCQIDTTATWLDGSVRWVLLHFVGRPDKSYFVKVGSAPVAQEIEGGITVREEADAIAINTGPAKFVIRATDALISQASLSGNAFLDGGGTGAYLIDNRGRKARLGGGEAEMSTRLLAKGPMCTVMRKEGWYVVEGGGPRIARGIVWLHFYGNCPFVRIVHRLVLTEDTNDVWSKDIGIEFPMALKGSHRATFDTSQAIDAQAMTLALKQEDTAWMLQGDFPHFMSKTSHFVLTHRSGASEKEIVSGTACGDWCDLSGEGTGVTLVLRDFAEQFPKEFTVSTSGITAHLWAGRCGRELDFRTPTLMKEYWGEWCKYANLSLEELPKIRSNAVSSAKTHVLWLLPHGPIDAASLAKRAHTAAERVLALPNPAWVCKTETMGPPMHPKDTERFPKEEAFISDFFDRLVLPNRVGAFPLTGYIAWGANPCTRYGKNEEGKFYAVWWRISGLVDYYLRRNVWTLYARSGERKYFDYGEGFNRFAGDMNMHHWDDPNPKDRAEAWKLWLEGALKVKGGFGHGLLAKGERIDAGGEGAYDGSIPIYWRRKSFKPGGSGAGIINNLFHFYVTGDWDVWELAENLAGAIKDKRWRFMHEEGLGRGALVHARYLTHLYSMNWDEEFGKTLQALVHRALDLESPNGINPKMPPSPLYKTDRNAITMLDYYRLTGDELAKKCFLKMVDYEFRFGGARPSNPIGYQNASGLKLTMAYRFTGQDKYLRLARQLMDIGLQTEPVPLSQQLAPGLDKIEGLPYKGQCFNYQACLNMPIVMSALSGYKGAGTPIPILLKELDSTERAWAVFEKKAGEPVVLEMNVRVEQEGDVSLVALGPDLAPIENVEVLEKEERFGNPFARGSRLYYVKAQIPSDSPPGVYRIGHRNPGPFAVIDANVDRMVLECPDGFWLRGFAPFYFRVPPDLETVEIFTSWPVRITRGDGSPAQKVSEERGGKLSLPVEGKSGFWRVDYEKTAFVRLLNLPPVVSCLTPERFFVPEEFVPVRREELKLPDPRATFVPGVIGPGLQLNGKDVLKLERGEKLPDGSCRNFPGALGTIEFYFRSNWGAVETAGVYRTLDAKWSLLSAGQVGVRYRYGLGSRDYAFMDFLCGQTRYKARGRLGSYGSQARIFPKAGEWLHVAATWDVVHTTQDYDPKKFSRSTRFFIVFINGRRYWRTWSFPTRLKSYIGKGFAKNFDISQIPEWITIGPGSGTFDELRISDVIRYADDFDPPKEPCTRDEHTKLLMHFDGSVEAVGGDGKKINVQYRDSSSGEYVPEIREW